MSKSYKFKPHKGIQKRVKITRNGHVKHGKVGQRHRKSRHTSKQNRQLRADMIACEVERRRLQRMLGFKIRRPEPAAASADAGADQKPGD